MREKTYSDKQREAQQQKKKDQVWEKTHPKTDSDNAAEDQKKPPKAEKPERHTA
jgi:hypothetical protein